MGTSKYLKIVDDLSKHFENNPRTDYKLTVRLEGHTSLIFERVRLEGSNVSISNMSEEEKLEGSFIVIETPGINSYKLINQGIIGQGMDAYSRVYSYDVFAGWTEHKSANALWSKIGADKFDRSIAMSSDDGGLYSDFLSGYQANDNSEFCREYRKINRYYGYSTYEVPYVRMSITGSKLTWKTNHHYNYSYYNVPSYTIDNNQLDYENLYPLFNCNHDRRIEITDIQFSDGEC